MILNSFAELARIYNKKGKKAKPKKEYGPLTEIESNHGEKAAVLWAIIHDRETIGRYGDKGTIIVTPAQLVEESGYTTDKVENALLTLVHNGYLRPTSDGKAVKAR
jgi:hypothetical protein